MTAMPAQPWEDGPEQPRRAAGQPGGGQFGPKTHQESDVTLDPKASDEDYNRDGTYLFPPYPRSAQQVIAYWSTAEVPDSILADIQQGYRVTQALSGENARHLYRRFEPEWSRGKTDQEQQATWEGRAAQRSAAIPDSMVRPIARISNMYWQAEEMATSALPEAREEAEAVFNHKVTLPNGIVTTPRELVKDYDFDIYKWAFRNEEQPEWW